MRKILTALVALVLVLSLSLVMAVPAAAATITVDDSGGKDHLTIQAAIDAASDGDTIKVYPGTYAEDLNINKQLTLTGVTEAGADNWTVGTAGAGATASTITYDGAIAHMIAVNADNVTIQGFKIDTANAATRGLNFGGVGAAQDGFTIQYCTFTANAPDRCISLSDDREATNFTITYCAFSGTGAMNWFTIGEGGECSATTTNTISYNTINGLVSQLRLHGDGHNIYDITYSNNTFTNVADGILLQETAEGNSEFGDIVVQNNTFAGGGTADYFFMVFSNVEDADFEGGSFSTDDITVNNNDFGVNKGTGSFEAVSFDATGTIVDLNAENNWWGDASGPTHAGNPGGTGADVSDNVDYTPWLTSPSGSVQVASSTGTGTVSFSTSEGTIQGLTAVAEGTLPMAGKPNLVFPHGFFSFRITGLITGTAVVTIVFPSAVPAGTQYWKYHVPGGWIDVTSLLGDNDGDNVLTLTLTDGGLGDEDSAANGVIVDQGGPGIPAGGVGGTVYPVDKLSILMPWIGLALLLALGAGVVAVRQRQAH